MLRSKERKIEALTTKRSRRKRKNLNHPQTHQQLQPTSRKRDKERKKKKLYFVSKFSCVDVCMAADNNKWVSLASLRSVFFLFFALERLKDGLREAKLLR